MRHGLVGCKWLVAMKNLSCDQLGMKYPELWPIHLSNEKLGMKWTHCLMLVWYEQWPVDPVDLFFFKGVKYYSIIGGLYLCFWANYDHLSRRLVTLNGGLVCEAKIPGRFRFRNYAHLPRELGCTYFWKIQKTWNMCLCFWRVGVVFQEG